MNSLTSSLQPKKISVEREGESEESNDTCLILPGCVWLLLLLVLLRAVNLLAFVCKTLLPSTVPSLLGAFFAMSQARAVALKVPEATCPYSSVLC